VKIFEIVDAGNQAKRVGTSTALKRRGTDPSPVAKKESGYLLKGMGMGRDLSLGCVCRGRIGQIRPGMAGYDSQ
jgi:hypothetical protein